MPNPVSLIVGPLAAPNAAAVAAAQTPAGAGNLALVGGGPVVLDQPRKVLVTFGIEGANRFVTISGTNGFGAAIVEAVAVPSGGAGTKATVQDFKTVTQVAVASAFTTNVSVGTNVSASSPWIAADIARNPFTIGYLFKLVAGAPSFQLELTLDDPNAGYWAPGVLAIPSSPAPQSNVPPFVFIDPTPAGMNGFGGAAKNASFQGQLSLPCFAYRATLNTADGTAAVQFQAIQAGYAGG